MFQKELLSLAASNKLLCAGIYSCLHRLLASLSIEKGGLLQLKCVSVSVGFNICLGAR